MNYVLIGAGGYVAPRHMKAIKETGGTVIAALDKHDSVGILDTYFPQADFFTEFERFDRYCEKNKEKIDYVVVCSPNYLHDAHIRFGLRIGADVICEKPVVLNPWNLEAIQEMEQRSGKKVNTILQLRLHPMIEHLRSVVHSNHLVDLRYVTPRGKWYDTSWKGDPDKSGGIITNIGIHLFDMLLNVLGPCQNFHTHQITKSLASGTLELDRGKVLWHLSTKGSLERSLIIDRVAVDFTDGFGDLHTKSYEEILAGRGFGLKDAKPAIELTYKLRNACAALAE